MTRTRTWGWILLGLLLMVGPTSAGEVPGFAVARAPTPVFNDAAFPGFFGGVDGMTLSTDRCGQFRSLEFIAPTGSVFTVIATITDGPVPVFRVATTEYPYLIKPGAYVDGRFLDLTETRPPERTRTLPPRDEIVRRLLAATGRPYVWGGNVSAGIRELLTFYPPSSPLSPDRVQAWTLAGLDCSGLLYEATGGFTPRNTSSLVHYGTAVPIAGMDARKIVKQIRPLDLIVWNGHVMIVMSGGRVIESRLVCGTPGNGGVIIRPLESALTELMQKRKPADAFPEEPGKEKNVFVIRRWYTETKSNPSGGTP